MEILSEEFPDLEVVVPVTDNVEEAVREAAEVWPVRTHIIQGEVEKFMAFDAADVALAASGTVSLELALARTPMIIAYKIGAFTAAIARRILLVPYITLINIILEHEAVPEYLQGRCTGKNLASALSILLTDEEARAQQLADIDAAVNQLTAEGEGPADSAAQAILSIIQ